MNKKIFCYTCENISNKLTDNRECPKCFSGNWEYLRVYLKEEN